MEYKKRVVPKANYQQQYDRYVAMAREAILGGDRVTAENYYQHAEHFFRTLNERPPVRYPTTPSTPVSNPGIRMEPAESHHPVQRAQRPQPRRSERAPTESPRFRDVERSLQDE